MIPAAGQFRARQTFLPEYIRRAIKLPQMDLEYTFWQMVPPLPYLPPDPASFPTPCTAASVWTPHPAPPSRQPEPPAGVAT